MRLRSQPVSVISRVGSVATTVALRAVLLEQADLAEEVAGTEVGDVLAAARDLDRALLDRHQLVRVVALAHELAAGRDADLLREGRDFSERVVRDRLEQRDRFEPAGVRHRSSYVAVGRDDSTQKRGISVQPN